MKREPPPQSYNTCLDCRESWNGYPCRSGKHDECLLCGESIEAKQFAFNKKYLEHSSQYMAQAQAKRRMT